jgi:hypothetical protein
MFGNLVHSTGNMLLNLKNSNRVSCCSKNEFTIKVLKIFILKNNLGYVMRLITITDFSKLTYFIGQINNFCNFNKKYSSVYRFLRANRLSLSAIIKSGLTKNIVKSSW